MTTPPDTIAPEILDVIRRAQAATEARAKVVGFPAETPAERHRVRRDRLRESGIGEVLMGRVARLVARDDLRSTQALRVVRRWLADEGEDARMILGLFGTVDSGKTVAAAWAIASCSGSRFVEAHDVAVGWRGDYGRQSPEILRCVTAPLLVVDELGLEDDPARAMRALTWLLNRRISPHRRTILLGNLGLRQLADRYGERIMSRLEEAGRLFQVAQTGMRRERKVW